VTRERQVDDGRVVLVYLAEAGRTALRAFRAQVGAALQEYLAETSDEQIEALAAATDTLATLVAILQRGAAGAS
jgi:DNA-binding MarR family transcriptional regulator